MVLASTPTGLGACAQGGRAVQPQLRGNGTPVARTDQTWTRRSCHGAAKDGARSGEGSHGGREACRSASRDEDDREHSVHAPSQKGIGISGERGPSVTSFLRRYRTHFAETLAGR